MHFFPGGSILWIIDYFGQKQHYKGKNALMMDLFLTNMQLLASQDIKLWTGVVWISVMFLSAVWTLILTAPIHCRGYIDEQEMKCYISPELFWRKKQTLYHLGMSEGELWVHIHCFVLFSVVQIVVSVSFSDWRVVTVLWTWVSLTRRWQTWQVGLQRSSWCRLTLECWALSCACCCRKELWSTVLTQGYALFTCLN